VSGRDYQLTESPAQSATIPAVHRMVYVGRVIGIFLGRNPTVKHEVHADHVSVTGIVGCPNTQVCDLTFRARRKKASLTSIEVLRSPD
jgi:hypothetical protein